MKHKAAKEEGEESDYDLIENESSIERQMAYKEMRLSFGSKRVTVRKDPNQLERKHRFKASDRSRNQSQRLSKLTKKSSTIKEHYYPEGGWGWIVFSITIVVNIFTMGLQLSANLTMFYLVQEDFASQISSRQIEILGASCYIITSLMSPFVVILCQRSSIRLTTIFGGLICSLGCLFSSFASQLHQVYLSYGILLGTGISCVRESSSLVLSQYFKKKRQKLELILEGCLSLSMVTMSLIMRSALRRWKWRGGLQITAIIMFSIFILGSFQRPASLYHPQRRAILHLKTQRKKKQQSRPTKVNLTDMLHDRNILVMMLASGLSSFLHFTPIFHHSHLWKEKLENLKNIADSDARETIKNQIERSILVHEFLFSGGYLIGVLIVSLVDLIRINDHQLDRLTYCQISMITAGVYLISSSYLFESLNLPSGWLFLGYGTSLSNLQCSIKMLIFRLIPIKYFNKTLVWIKVSQSLGMSLGLLLASKPKDMLLTQSSPTIHGAAILSFMGAVVLFAPTNRTIKYQLPSSQDIDGKIAGETETIGSNKRKSNNRSVSFSSSPQLIGSAIDVGDTGKDSGNCISCGRNYFNDEIPPLSGYSTQDSITSPWEQKVSCDEIFPKAYSGNNFSPEQQDYHHHHLQTHLCKDIGKPRKELERMTMLRQCYSLDQLNL